MRLAIILASLSILATFTAAAEERVAVVLKNAGTTPLRCQLMLAHWMTGEIRHLGSGESLTLALARDTAGQLFITRPGEARPFHVETLLCGREEGFGRGEALDLSALRSGRSRSLAFACAAEERPLCRSLAAARP